MDIDAVHQKLASEGVFAKAEEFADAIGDIEDGYEWIAKRFKFAHDKFAKVANTAEEMAYLACLKEAYETIESVFDVIDDANRDFGYVMQRLGERPPNNEA